MAERVCPWWLGYLLASPVRRLLEKPEEVLAPHVESGVTAMDIGCGMGFFSLPLAELVGPSGRVICVDLQERMISSLRKRASRAGLADRIETRVCSASSLGTQDLEGKVDFVLTFAMVHEVPDAAGLLTQIRRRAGPGRSALDRGAEGARLRRGSRRDDRGRREGGSFGRRPAGHQEEPSGSAGEAIRRKRVIGGSGSHGKVG